MIPLLPAIAARFSVHGIRPTLADGLLLSETLRSAAMSRSQRIQGNASSVLSGKAADGSRLRGQHGHAHYLFEDADEDGRVDHLCVWCPGGLDEEDRKTLAGLSRIWTRDGRQEWRLELVHLGSIEQLSTASQRFGRGRVWESATPYVLTRHPKRTRGGERKCRPDGTWIDGPEDQLRAELRVRGLPDVSQIEPIGDLHAGGRRWRAGEFRRSRMHRPRAGMAAMGVFVRIHLVEPVTGPLALGGECHFGLGAFRALPSEPVPSTSGGVGP